MKENIKNGFYSIYTKIILFIIVVLSFSFLVLNTLELMENISGRIEVVDQANYYESYEYLWDIMDTISDYKELNLNYVNEDNIKNGKTASDIRIRDLMVSRYDHKYTEEYEYSGEDSVEEDPFKNVVFFEKSDQEIEKIKAGIRDEIINKDLKKYKILKEKLSRKEGIYLYGVAGEKNYGNIKNFNSSDYKAYIQMDGINVVVEPYSELVQEKLSNFSHDQMDLLTEKISVGFTDDYINPRLDRWKQDRAYAIDGFKLLILVFIILGVSFILLVVIIGRTSRGSKDIHLNFFDRMFNEIKLTLAICTMVLWVESTYRMNSDYLKIPYTIVLAAFGLLTVLSMIKDIKYRRFFKNSCVYYVLSRIFDIFKGIYTSGSRGFKILILVVIYNGLVLLTFFMFPITMIIATWLILKKLKDYFKIKDGVEEIRTGNTDFKIDIEKNGSLKELADDINTISDGLNEAIDKELKSERLKNELITNVSHDIRTPLTSIITYSDLLEKEEDLAKVKEYSRVIQEKSARLKVLTDDLFEASKINSGNIPVELEKIDIVSLITQSVGEVNSKILEKNLEFKVKYHESPMWVLADGELLWRVVDNLLTNIFKYALDGSRVYIDILRRNNYCVLEMKNISASELNISPDELMERFKRGDESRTTQGSGLGLSIAKSLVEAQGGRFKLEIDGDLFKASVRIPIEV